MLVNHPAVAECPACFSPVAAQMRPYDDIQPQEWANYHKARRLTDPNKLAALLPAWIKTHQRNVAPPKPFVYVPDPEPVFPSWTGKQPMRHDSRDFPPVAEEGTAAYIAAFDVLNGFDCSRRPVAYEFHSYPEEQVAMAA